LQSALNTLSLIVILAFSCIESADAATTVRTRNSLDSLNNLLDSQLTKTDRLKILHQASGILYKEDSDNVLLFNYAKEGVELAKELNAIDQGSDLAVWILRANIYLRSYHRNPPYYSYLKKLYKAKKIEDKRFLVTALSRNAEFYLIDSLNFMKSKLYAEKAIRVIDDHNLVQHKQHILLQLCQALYKLNETDNFNKVYSQISIDSFAKANKIIHKDYLTFSGDIAFDERDFEKACNLYKKAVQFLETSDFATMELLTKKIEK